MNKLHKLNGIAVYEREGSPPPVFFAHAAGYHGRCWNKVIRLIENHSYAIDFMGHGQSERPSLPITSRQYAQNVIDVILQLDLNDLIGVGHSMGGHAITAAAAELPERFQKLILIDPVITHINYFEGYTVDELPIIRRRKEFASPEEMFEKLKDRPNFNLWDPEVLRDYCVYGLIDNNLACDPQIEAATYLAYGDPWLMNELHKVTVPVEVVRAQMAEEEMSFAHSPTDPNLAKLLPNARDIYLKNHSHFIPMEDPQLVADLIKQGHFTR